MNAITPTGTSQAITKIPNFVLNDETGRYETRRPLSGKQIINAALKLAQANIKRKSNTLSNPNITREYLSLTLGCREQEVFGCLWLDNKHRVIEFEELFYGTISETSVYPREVVKRALLNNAAAVIAVHNHPSGSTEPSIADRCITQKLKESLALVDIKLIDHMIVGGSNTASLAELGYI